MVSKGLPDWHEKTMAGGAYGGGRQVAPPSV